MENGTEETQENRNSQGAPETTEAIKAELEEEKKARAAVEAAAAEKDTRIAELETSLSESKQTAESLRARFQEGAAISL
jgi:predicted RNase H-like nuclease (RuvC/YqgF family)